MRGQRTMETIKEEEEEIEQESSGSRSGQKMMMIKWRIFATHTMNYENPWNKKS